MFAATGCYVGRIPVAPGTFGSVLGLPLAWGLSHLAWGWQVAAAVACFLLGVAVSGRAAQVLGLKDPPGVVIDEIAAFAVVFLLTPFNWQTAIVGFALFRLFDITKLWPARQLERLPGGWGIMADDSAAGVYSALALWCIARGFGLN